jgi:uncharacterized protein (TIGR03086 family)
MTADSATIDSDAIDELDAVLTATETLLAGVRPEQQHDPTPCPAFDVSQLVDHVIGWSASFAARLSGHDLDGDPNAWHAGPDPRSDLHDLGATIVARYRAGGPATEKLPIAVLLMDYQVHGWDLAVATGQEVAYPAHATERALEAGRVMMKPEYRGADTGFGPEVDPPAGSTILEDLVAFLGRDPAWRP